jgi:chorismate mutase
MRPFSRSDRVGGLIKEVLGDLLRNAETLAQARALLARAGGDPAREAQQIKRLERLSQEADLDPDFARKFLGFIISEVIRHHENLQK